MSRAIVSRPIALALSLLLWLLASIPITQAQSFPSLTGRVVDQAQLLDQSLLKSLSATLAEHEAQTSNQIVVATIADLEGYAIADYANRLGRDWQIGTAENNNGVLLVVAPNERKVRIEVGYGLEGALTDALSSIIIQREILPAFRNNNYPGGISNGVDAIIQAIAGEYTAPTGSSDNTGQNDINDDLAGFIPLIFIAMVALPQILRKISKPKAASSVFPAGFAGLFATISSGNIFIGIAIAVLVFLLFFFTGIGGSGGGGSSGRRGGYIGTGGFGGGGFGGGGFGGGGGSFGGGGASGSW